VAPRRRGSTGRETGVRRKRVAYARKASPIAEDQGEEVDRMEASPRGHARILSAASRPVMRQCAISLAVHGHPRV
jgi:hypothetical protein